MSGAWAAECEASHVVRSMSRKARSPDNARAEGFFGTLKCDFFEGRDWSGVPFGEFRERLDAYIGWYRDGKIKEVARLEDDGGVQEGHGLRRHGRGLGRKNVRGPGASSSARQQRRESSEDVFFSNAKSHHLVACERETTKPLVPE